jgi:TolB-like protein/DNA-binding winged helix-turn-helix (wHTH) protein
MGEHTGSDIVRFAGFCFDRSRGCLLRQDEDGSRVPVSIGSRALEVLGLLIDRRGDLVSKDEIMDAVWPGTVVEGANVTVQISALRRILDDGRSDGSNLNVQVAALRRIIDDGRAEGSCIQTVPGRGYRFVVPVTRAELPATASAPPAGNGGAGPIVEHGQPQPAGARSLLGGTPPIPSSRARHRFWGGIVAAVIGAVVLVSTVAIWNWHSPWFSEARPVPRLSIVVLPFANLGNDPDQEYFVDAITDDVTTDLSRIAGSFVIARNTASTYKGKLVDAKQLGRELGVRYVLQGSVRKAEKQVNVNAQFIDAVTGAQHWAERFEGEAGALLDLENAITGRIASSVQWWLVLAEARHPADHPDALDYVLRGRAAYTKPPSRESYAAAVSLFERAVALDPGSTEAQGWLASALTARVLNFKSDSPSSDLQGADEAIARALALSPHNARAHFAQAQVRRAQSRCEEAIPEYERTIALDRNFSGAYAYLGACKLMIGSLDQVIPYAEQAIRLNPRTVDASGWYYFIGAVHLLRGRIDEAIVWFERSRSVYADHHRARAALAAAYALKGEMQRASAELAGAQKLSDRYSSIAALTAAGREYLTSPKNRGLAESTYLAGLRLAGMPEHVAD